MTTETQTAPITTTAEASAVTTGTITAQQAAALLQFMQRAQLQGAEMPAYVDVFNTLSKIVADAQAEAA